jgi:hypothetical protein
MTRDAETQGGGDEPVCILLLGEGVQDSLGTLC